MSTNCDWSMTGTGRAIEMLAEFGDTPNRLILEDPIGWKFCQYTDWSWWKCRRHWGWCIWWDFVFPLKILWRFGIPVYRYPSACPEDKDIFEWCLPKTQRFIGGWVLVGNKDAVYSPGA